MAEKYECKDFQDIAKCFQTLHTHIDSEIESLKKTERNRQVSRCGKKTNRTDTWGTTGHT